GKRRTYRWEARCFELDAGLQVEVVLLRCADRKTRLERSDSRQSPAVQGLTLESFIFRQRQFPVVAQHEALPRVKKRQCPIAAGVNGIHQTLKSRGVVDRFAKSIRRCELQPVRETLLDAGLETVVGRVADRVLRKNT